jgi:hypothetical protein
MGMGAAVGRRTLVLVQVSISALSLPVWRQSIRLFFNSAILDSSVLLLIGKPREVRSQSTRRQVEGRLGSS